MQQNAALTWLDGPPPPKLNMLSCCTNACVQGLWKPFTGNCFTKRQDTVAPRRYGRKLGKLKATIYLLVHGAPWKQHVQRHTNTAALQALLRTATPLAVVTQLQHWHFV
jgi:hypothetical protein